MTGSAKTLCIPYTKDNTCVDQSGIVGHKCFNCGKDAKVKALWGRSYWK